MTQINIPGRPVTAERARRGAGKGMYNTTKYSAWLEEVALRGRQAHAGQPTWESEIALGVDIRAEDGRHGDTTNYIKGIEDGLQYARVYANDRQITTIVARLVIDKANPGIVAHIMPVSLPVVYAVSYAMDVLCEKGVMRYG